MDDIEEFIKYFKNVFGSSWSNKFHSYLGYKTIEKELKKHLKIDDKFIKAIKTKKRKHKT